MGTWYSLPNGNRQRWPIIELRQAAWPPSPVCKSWCEVKSAVIRSPGSPIDRGHSGWGKGSWCASIQVHLGSRVGTMVPILTRRSRLKCPARQRVLRGPSREARPACRLCSFLSGTLKVHRGCACLGSLLEFSALRPACSFLNLVFARGPSGVSLELGPGAGDGEGAGGARGAAPSLC
jgi:hypothetical protein